MTVCHSLGLFVGAAFAVESSDLIGHYTWTVREVHTGSIHHQRMPSWFDSCDDSCGWVAAIVSALAYGSFGVPIKETLHLDAHPLVLQSYKTGTMFLTCWLVLALGVQVMWTRWGLLSGLLWVLGGCGGIYAIRMAGMAIAVGCWASVMIIVNFVWGILVFREPVADFWGTVGAFSLLVLGLLGMSRFSAPAEKGDDDDDGLNDDHIVTPLSDDLSSSESSSESPYKSLNPAKQNIRQRGDKDTASTAADPEDGLVRDDNSEGSLPDNVSELVVLFGKQMSKRRAGLLGAVFNGLMTGSSLVPLHYAKAEGFGGANFMISFASGALIANALVWAVFFAHRWMELSVADMVESTRLYQVYASLPSFHFRDLWLPGFAAGTS